uniref:NAB domain-containing protein n=1 Tax=Davidia involucrata TaxID=16924 RepID=A0A5B6YRZ8_DAVIN
MTKNRWRESIMSFENHIDPEKNEELKGTKIGKYSFPEQPQSLQYYWRLWNCTIETKRMQYKALLPAHHPERGFLWDGRLERVRNTLLIPECEIDDKVTKFMKLKKNKNKQNQKDGNLRKDSQLVEFIQDFHKQYQSLSALYDNLRGEVKERLHGREEEEGTSSYTSNSDSVSYYSLDGIGGKTSPARSELQKVKGNLKQKLETSNLEVTDLRNKLTSVTEEKEALNSEYMVSLSKIQESEKIIECLGIKAEQTESIKQNLMDESSQLKEKLAEKEKELLSLTKTHQVIESEASGQIKRLESQVTSMKLELETLCTQKRELEERIEHKATEAKQVGTRILELEMASKEREDELSTTLKKFEENENNLMSKIEDLMAQVNNMQLEVDALRSKKYELEECVVCKSNEASAQVKDVMDHLNILQQELESLSSQKTDSESQLEKQTQEISAFRIQIENLTEKLASTTLHKQRTLEVKEGLRVQVKDLELEVNSLSSQKIELEEQIISKDHDADQLRVEKEGLHDRILEMEKLQVERGDELSVFQTKLEGLELDSLQTEKSQMELQIEREKEESSESLTQLEKQNMELTSKIADQEGTLKGQDDIINKLNEENKQVKCMFQESNLNLQIAERKTGEMAEELRKKFEDSLRLLSRRIRVAEQLHVENKDFYRKTKVRYEQEHVDLKERITTNEVAVRRIKDISLTANDMLTGLDSVVLKFGDCSGNFLNRISKVSTELKLAKEWARRKNNAIKQVKEDVDCLLAQLDVKEAEVLGFREKVWKLENKVRELEKIVKEKEEGMLGLGEEKREAIRQLCVWNDYHHSHSDYLKKMLSEMTVRSQCTP